MIVNIITTHENGSECEIQQKMIKYSLYEKLEKVVLEKNQKIAVLNQEIEHLESLIKLKNLKIAELIKLVTIEKRSSNDNELIYAALNSRSLDTDSLMLSDE